MAPDLDHGIIILARKEAESGNYQSGIGLLVSFLHKEYPWASEEIGKAVKQYSEQGKPAYDSSIKCLESTIGTIKKSMKSKGLDPRGVEIFHELGELRDGLFTKLVKEGEKNIDTLIENLRAGVANYHFSQIMGYKKEDSNSKKHLLAMRVKELESIKEFENKLKNKGIKTYMDEAQELSYKLNCNMCSEYLTNKMYEKVKGNKAEEDYVKRINLIREAKNLFLDAEKKGICPLKNTGEQTQEEIAKGLYEIRKGITEYIIKFHNNLENGRLNDAVENMVLVRGLGLRESAVTYTKELANKIKEHEKYESLHGSKKAIVDVFLLGLDANGNK